MSTPRGNESPLPSPFRSRRKGPGLQSPVASCRRKSTRHRSWWFSETADDHPPPRTAGRGFEPPSGKAAPVGGGSGLHSRVTVKPATPSDGSEKTGPRAISPRRLSATAQAAGNPFAIADGVTGEAWHEYGSERVGGRAGRRSMRRVLQQVPVPVAFGSSAGMERENRAGSGSAQFGDTSTVIRSPPSTASAWSFTQSWSSGDSSNSQNFSVRRENEERPRRGAREDGPRRQRFGERGTSSEPELRSS